MDELLRQAHARGIGVIMDYVINHSAAQHPALSTPSGRRQPLPRLVPLAGQLKPGGWNIYGNDPWRSTRKRRQLVLRAFLGPDARLQPAQPGKVVAWHHDNLRFWLNRGVDGFRFDAVGNLVENGPAAWENQPENRPCCARCRHADERLRAALSGLRRPERTVSLHQPTCGSAFAFNTTANLIAGCQG
jgi:alpha-amylase